MLWWRCWLCPHYVVWLLLLLLLRATPTTTCWTVAGEGEHIILVAAEYEAEAVAVAAAVLLLFVTYYSVHNILVIFEVLHKLAIHCYNPPPLRPPLALTNSLTHFIICLSSLFPLIRVLCTFVHFWMMVIIMIIIIIHLEMPLADKQSTIFLIHVNMYATLVRSSASSAESCVVHWHTYFVTHSLPPHTDTHRNTALFCIEFV